MLFQLSQNTCSEADCTWARGVCLLGYTYSAYVTLRVNRNRKPRQDHVGLCIHFILETWSSWLGLAPPLGTTSFWRISSLILHSGLSPLPVEGTSGKWHLLPTQATEEPTGNALGYMRAQDKVRLVEHLLVYKPWVRSTALHKSYYAFLSLQQEAKGRRI